MAAIEITTIIKCANVEAEYVRGHMDQTGVDYEESVDGDQTAFTFIQWGEVSS